MHNFLVSEVFLNLTAVTQVTQAVIYGLNSHEPSRKFQITLKKESH